MLLERTRFLEVLYDKLPDNKNKVLTGKSVLGIEQGENGVLVRLQDGSVESGDIVIGADGVHSTVRGIMWDNSNAAAPDTISAAEKRCKSRKIAQLNLLTRTCSSDCSIQMSFRHDTSLTWC
jgi:2-polyprenyl-6-methoxyphenol hydroxylase-like FAD-dependent oxidoreductase